MIRTSRLRFRQRLQIVAIGALLVVLSGAIAGCSNDFDSRLAEVYELQESGRLEESIVELRAILEQDAEHAEANFLLGSALVQLRLQRRAIPPLEIAARSEIYAIPANVMLASAQLRASAYDDAISTSSRLLELDPENVTALFTRGRSRLALGKSDAALEDADRLLAIRGDSHNGLALKAEALVQLDRREEAEAIWIALRDRSAASGSERRAARSCGQLAFFYRKHEQNDRADTAYRECLEAHPTEAFLQVAASEFYVQLGQIDRALEVLSAGVDAAPEDIRAWNRLANSLYDHRGPAAAKAKLEEMVDHFDTPTAWRLLADFHRKVRQTEQARQAVEEAILRSEQTPESFSYALADLLVEEGRIQRAREVGQSLSQPSYRHLLAGAISLKTGNPRRALERLEAGLALWPDNAHAHYLAGQAALQLRDRRRAVIEFREAVRTGGATTDAAMRLAELYFARGEYPIATRIAKYQIAKRPYLDPAPYHIAIRSLIQLDRVDEAIEIADELASVDPAATAVVVEMTAIKRAQGGAKASSEYILASGRDLTDPENEPILRALSTDLNALDRADEALGHIDRAIARDASRAPLHDLRARVLSHLGNVEEADAATERALEIDPGFSPALEMKAYLALERGDHATALAALDEATEIAPGDSGYPYSAATVARKMGDTEGAIARLEEALARQPLFGPAANDLAWILATDRLDLERALRLAQAAARQDRSSDTLTTLGWVRHQRGEYGDAIRNYRTALETNGDLPTVRYRLGLSLSEAGQTDEAEGLFDALVEGPDFPEIEAARAELDRLKGS